MQGSVRKHGASWRYAIYLGVENGKRKYLRKGGFRTQREAQKAMREVLSSKDKGSFVEPTQITVGEYLTKWLEDKSTVVRFGTMRKYKWMVNYRIVPVLGSISLQSLSPQHVQSFYNSLRTGDAPLSPRSILHVHRILHEALDRARRWELVVKNVVSAVETPKVNKPEMKVWTAEESREFLRIARGNRYYVAFALALETGMRQGEILALRWSDVNLESAELHVKQTDYLGHVNHPKTIQGRRTIPLTPFMMQVLRSHRVAQAKERLFLGQDYLDNDLVVAKQNGTSLRSRSLNNHWYKLLKKSDLPVIRFHDLRHTFASLMLAAGVSPKTLVKIIGHATIAFLLDTYAHVYKQQENEAANLYQSFVHGNATNE
jgi:integrase